MNEDQRIERATAEGFLLLFNQQLGADYEIVETADAPDIRCQDSIGRALNLEITLTEDRESDIKAALGRSDHRNAENFNPSLPASSLQDDVLKQAVERINKKLRMRYGASTALVVRDASGVEWDWDLVVDELKMKLDLARNPFDKGIWILNRFKTKLYQVT